jgi:hypothetical protein
MEDKDLGEIAAYKEAVVPVRKLRISGEKEERLRPLESWAKEGR